MYYAYIIESEKNERYYIGQTDDLKARLDRHNKGRNHSTKPYLPWRLKWWKEFDTRSEAVLTEKRIKSIKKRARIEIFVVENKFRGIAQSG